MSVSGVASPQAPIWEAAPTPAREPLQFPPPSSVLLCRGSRLDFKWKEFPSPGKAPGIRKFVNRDGEGRL